MTKIRLYSHALARRPAELQNSQLKANLRLTEAAVSSFMMSIQQVAYTVISVLVVILIIVTFWTLMWKFVLEPNPLIRDFFDLDQKDKPKLKGK